MWLFDVCARSSGAMLANAEEDHLISCCKALVEATSYHVSRSIAAGSKCKIL